jgi:hypothetical protein
VPAVAAGVAAARAGWWRWYVWPVVDPATSALADATRSVLLAVRLRPSAPPPVLEAVLASMTADVDDLGRLLGRLEMAGLIDDRPGAPGRWRLTPEGRHEGERLLAVELDRLGVRDQVVDAYERFLPLNGGLLRACTDWQLRDANPSQLQVNDHTDPVFDRAVLARLGAISDAALPICRDLTARLVRFSGYEPRFTAAMDRIRAGDLDAVSGPTGDSYHAVWFELHDNLLATLGRDRSAEPLPDS